jgi:hypothetical protein
MCMQAQMCQWCNSIKVNGVVDSPATSLIAILNEVDLIPTFLTIVKVWIKNLLQVHLYHIIASDVSITCVQIIGIIISEDNVGQD